MITLGIECTAHTLGVGIFDGKLLLADARDVYRPAVGGIHPIEARKHHDEVREKVLQEALKTAGLQLSDIDLIAYSAGPGLPPCLKSGAELATMLSHKTKKPVIAVNHPVAHIEIGRFLTKCNDPIIMYVSGGNTQIIGYAGKRYRVFGETEDIAIGNAMDTFMREATGNAGFGGPLMDKMAEGGKFIELPYVVKGMDLSFSGILTAAVQKARAGANMNDLCFSFIETCFSMLTEVTERALAHTGKQEVLITGGVTASPRLREMLSIMCEERGAHLYVCPIEYSGDNGSMIAVAGHTAYNAGQKATEPKETHGVRQSVFDFDSRWRVDEVEINWIE